MKNLIEQWKSQKSQEKKAQKKLVTRLKRQKGKKLDALADELHEEVFSHIDCLDCANCCSSIPPMLNRTDISRIARHLGMKVARFESEYLRMDEDGDMVMKTTPCPFLMEDHACMIYEYRPKACREYPHTDHSQFSQRMRLHATNAQYCPAVFHILKRMEGLIENGK